MALACQSVGVTNTSLISGTAVDVKAVIGLAFCNVDVSPHVVTVYLVPNGGSPDGSNVLLKSLSVAATDTYYWSDIKLILQDGESVVAITDVAGVLSSVISWHKV